MTAITCQIDIAADRTRVLEALDTHDGLTGWWTDDVNRKDDVLYLNFPAVPEPFRLRRDRADETRVAWVSVGAFPPHWAGTTITWDLTGTPEGTGVAFSHSGFPEGDPEISMITETWSTLMTRLKEYAETGRANPFFTVREPR